MDRSDVTATLLSALLANQDAMIVAISGLATWAKTEGSPEVASRVREQLVRAKNNESIIGRCIGALMQPTRQVSSQKSASGDTQPSQM